MLILVYSSAECFVYVSDGDISLYKHDFKKCQIHECFAENCHLSCCFQEKRIFTRVHLLKDFFLTSTVFNFVRFVQLNRLSETYKIEDSWIETKSVN